jgi:hypothetical protein
MEPDNELTDPELSAMLSAWKIPGAPTPLRVPWWRRSISVPLPVAAAIFVAIVYGAIRLAAPAPVVVKWQPVNEIKLRIIRNGNDRNTNGQN